MSRYSGSSGYSGPDTSDDEMGPSSSGPRDIQIVPVIELPYWRVTTEERGVTLQKWEFGIASTPSWTFRDIDYQSWGPCPGFPESSIFSLDACEDFQELVQKNLCTEDQTGSIDDLLRWDVLSMPTGCFDSSSYTFCFVQVCALRKVTKPRLGRQKYPTWFPLLPALDMRSCRIWFTLTRFLLQASLSPAHEFLKPEPPPPINNHVHTATKFGMDPPARPSRKLTSTEPPAFPSSAIASRHTTFIETSIFKYLDFGLSCALVTGWFDPARTPCVLGLRGATEIKPLTISEVQKRADKAFFKRRKAEKEAQNARFPSIHRLNTTISHPYNIPPRRLWDLKMNRVVPWYLINNPAAKAPPPFIAISHSWVDDKERTFVETPIHRYAWPVPLPQGVTLDAIREEVLGSFPGFRYCWLDVLCLRQKAKVHKGHDHWTESKTIAPVESSEQRALVKALDLERETGDHDALRNAEHRIDVPTIGNVYKLAKGVFRYPNGLGRRFSEVNWDHPNHWFNRAWTLQEAVPGSVDGGVADWPGNYLNVWGSKGEVRKRFRDFIAEIENMTGESASVIALAQEMGHRHATSEIDKITGLSYLLGMKRLPTYTTNRSESDAWRRSLWEMPRKHLLELLFKCPVVDSHLWTPSWNTVSSLSPTFVPYPDPDDLQQSRTIDLRRRYFEICEELGYPRSMRHEMYHDLIITYSAFKADLGCPGYPFALNQPDVHPDVGQDAKAISKPNKLKEANEDSYAPSDNGNSTNSTFRHFSSTDDDQSGDDEDGYIDVVKVPSARRQRNSIDREMRISGWCLKVLSFECTGGVNYCLQVNTSTTKTKDIPFFISHEGVELKFGKMTSHSQITNETPQLQNHSATGFLLFTRALFIPGHHSNDRRPTDAKPHTRCSAWLVLRPSEQTGTYQKVGVLRSDATFTYEWMTPVLLRAHLRTGAIYVDITKTQNDSPPENVEVNKRQRPNPNPTDLKISSSEVEAVRRDYNLIRGRRTGKRKREDDNHYSNKIMNDTRAGNSNGGASS